MKLLKLKFFLLCSTIFYYFSASCPGLEGGIATAVATKPAWRPKTTSEPSVPPESLPSSSQAADLALRAVLLRGNPTKRPAPSPEPTTQGQPPEDRSVSGAPIAKKKRCPDYISPFLGYWREDEPSLGALEAELNKIPRGITKEEWTTYVVLRIILQLDCQIFKDLAEQLNQGQRDFLQAWVGAFWSILQTHETFVLLLRSSLSPGHLIEQISGPLSQIIAKADSVDVEGLANITLERIGTAKQFLENRTTANADPKAHYWRSRIRLSNHVMGSCRFMEHNYSYSIAFTIIANTFLLFPNFLAAQTSVDRFSLAMSIFLLEQRNIYSEFIKRLHEQIKRGQVQ